MVRCVLVIMCQRDIKVDEYPTLCVCEHVKEERRNPFAKISSPLLFLILSYIIELDSRDPWPRSRQEEGDGEHTV